MENQSYLPGSKTERPFGTAWPRNVHDCQQKEQQSLTVVRDISARVQETAKTPFPVSNF